MTTQYRIRRDVGTARAVAMAHNLLVRYPHRPLGIMGEDLVEGKRFDQLARTVGASGSRRRLLGALLVAVLGGLRLRVATADDDGTVIADASGGNHNHATVIDPPTGQHDRNRDNDRNDDEGKDKAKDEDSGDALCPPGSNTFCCQCTNDSGDDVGCVAAASNITDCPAECGLDNIAEVLVADPGQEFTCEADTCTQIPC